MHVSGSWHDSYAFVFGQPVMQFHKLPINNKYAKQYFHKSSLSHERFVKNFVCYKPTGRKRGVENACEVFQSFYGLQLHPTSLLQLPWFFTWSYGQVDKQLYSCTFIHSHSHFHLQMPHMRLTKKVIRLGENIFKSTFNNFFFICADGFNARSLICTFQSLWRDYFSACICARTACAVNSARNLLKLELQNLRNT